MDVDYSELSEGDSVVGYRIIRKLGSSPLRNTYEAENPVLERRVAIKFCTNPKHKESFLQIAKLISRLDHPNISSLYDAGEIDGVPYIVAEFIEGTHLGELIVDHWDFDLTTLLRMMQQIASALAHAHDNGILHRNMKPQNIVIDKSGRAVLSDFEIATPVGAEVEERPVGTPPFMAPEQFALKNLTEKVDLWGVGATLYWALSGCYVPYSHPSKEEIEQEQMGELCVDFFSDNSSVSYECLVESTPHYVRKILEKCLAFSPEDRWLSMAHLRTGLDAAITEIDRDSAASTMEFSVPGEGQTIIVYAESHGDELSGDYRQFELRKFLGDGHFGVVYQALETFSGVEVAIKFLKPEHLRNQDAVDRFRRESKLLTQISHPNVVKLYSQGRYGSTFFIALQLLDGEDLECMLRNEGPLSIASAMDYGMQILAGISCLHENGITHRDLKPANMGFSSGKLLIGDFGLARGEEVTKLTAVGTVMGTLAYMPPEQVRGETVTSASDVYSTGMILFQMLTAKLPHQASSASELMRRIENDPIPELGAIRTDVTPELSKLVATMLSKLHDERPSAVDAEKRLAELSI